jgi:hypothetical protein
MAMHSETTGILRNHQRALVFVGVQGRARRAWAAGRHEGRPRPPRATGRRLDHDRISKVTRWSSYERKRWFAASAKPWRQIIRLVGVTLSNFQAGETAAGQLDLALPD